MAGGGISSRPVARVKSKVTPEEVKPFIAQANKITALAGLQKGAPVMTGGVPDYGVGDRVRHVKYGDGTVKALVNETKDYKVTVEFDQMGQKIMYASFAKLQKI